MVKFKATQKNRKKLIGIGLTDENFKRLKEGQPIYFRGTDLEADEFNFTIFYGETEEKIYESFKASGIGMDKIIDKKGTLHEH